MKFKGAGMSKLTATLLILIIVIQGGFYPNAYLIVGTCVAFLLLIRGRMQINKIAFFSLIGLLALYLLSCIAHAFSIGQYFPVFQVLSCVIFYCLISSFNEQERSDLYTGIIVGGIIVACLGLACYTANLPIPAAVSNERLQSTLQYADASAILFVLALMAMHGTEGRLRLFRPIVLLALLLTFSFGGLLAYCIAIALYACRQKRGERLKAFFCETADLSIAALFAGTIFYFEHYAKLNVGMILVLAGFCCLCPVWRHMTDSIVRKLALRITSLVLLGAEAAGVLFLRGTQAADSFVNRLTLISYGMNALQANPILGIGPGAWATQRAQYETVYDRANIIHSSYTQIAVDAGAFALLLIAVLSVFVLLWLYKSQKHWKFPAAAGLLFHGLIDLSFCFTGIVFCGIAISAEEEKKGWALPAWAVRLAAAGAIAAFIYMDAVYF